MKKSSGGALILISQPHSLVAPIISSFKHTLIMCFWVLLWLTLWIIMWSNTSLSLCWTPSCYIGVTALAQICRFRSRHESCLQSSQSEIWIMRVWVGPLSPGRPYLNVSYPIPVTGFVYLFLPELSISGSLQNRNLTVMGNTQCAFVRFWCFSPILLSFLHHDLLWRGERA